MKEITLHKNIISDPKEFLRLLIAEAKFYNKKIHPNGGCFTGLRTDSLMNIEWFRRDFSDELFTKVVELTGIDLLENNYDIDFYAEFHSAIELEPPVIQQHNPNADTVIMVFLNPNENFQSDMTIYSPNMDEFDPYNISDKNNFAVKQSVKNVFNSAVMFDSREYYAIDKWHGEERIDDGNFNLFITITQKMS